MNAEYQLPLADGWLTIELTNLISFFLCCCLAWGASRPAMLLAVLAPRIRAQRSKSRRRRQTVNKQRFVHL